MSGSSNNSWTIVTPETVAETLRPLVEGREVQDEPCAPTDFGAKPSNGADVLSVEDHLKSEEMTINQSEETDNAPVSDLDVSASSEVISSSVPDSQVEDPPVDSALSSTEPESFSDSYTHLSPCPDDSQASPLTTETLGNLDSGQEDEVGAQTDIHNETQHQTTQQEFQQEPEPPQWAHLDTPPDSTIEGEVVGEKPETAVQEAQPEVRRRRSLLAALERIGRTDEEEEAEEDFQLPQREEDTGITLNKCILGAVILLGLGTIFISAESDYSTSELKDTQAPGKQEWLNPDIAQPAAEADTAELLSKLNKENEDISLLQGQLQSQNEELKAAKTQATEGTEQLQQQEVEKENSRLQIDMETLPVLQKELEKMKRELESITLLQKEVETLRSTVTQLKLNSAATETPPSGQTEDNSHVTKHQQLQKKDKHDRGERKEWKDEMHVMKKEKKHRKDGSKMEAEEKEWKKDKSESRQFEKQHKENKQHKEDKHSKHSSESKEWKKDKSEKVWERGDEGKPWKDKNENKEWKDKSDKKSKRDQFNEDRHWKSKEEKRELKDAKQHGDRHRDNGDKSWKKGRDYHKEEGKERKCWNDKDCLESKNGRNNGERKPWSEKNKDEKKWKKRDDKYQWSNGEEEWKERQNDKKHKKEWDKDESGFEKHKQKSSDHKEHTWTERKPAFLHSRPSPSQPDYWARQRGRIQHSTRPLQPCDTPNTCAKAEGVRPVHLNEFETILQNYLSKAQTAGVDASQIDELRKLATESFKNGLFVHDQMSFQDYVEDLGDILEDLVEGEDGSDGQESPIEDEMEGFEREVMQTFVLSGIGERERVKGDWRKESTRGRG